MCAAAAPAKDPPFPSLQAITLSTLAANPASITSLQGVSESHCQLLLRLVLDRCALTPRLAQLFLESPHASVKAELDGIDILQGMFVLDDTPPPSRLGCKKG